jgi:uracil-DNA glycosylase
VSDTLEELTRRARACRICAEHPIGRPLPHEPRPVLLPSARARILIASQAPGTKVHLSGMPFTDASGDRLRSWLGVTSEEFYDPENFAIVPMGFCFPGQDAKGADLPPRRECAPAWRAPLIAAMPQIELVLTIGLYAQAWHMGETRRGSLTETVQNWREVFAAPARPVVLPLPHPSWRNTGWLKKNPWFEMDLLPFLKTEIRRRSTAHPSK